MTTREEVLAVGTMLTKTCAAIVPPWSPKPLLVAGVHALGICFAMAQSAHGWSDAQLDDAAKWLRGVIDVHNNPIVPVPYDSFPHVVRGDVILSSRGRRLLGV